VIARIIEARVAHIPEIASRVRDADVLELWSLSCLTPAQAMYYGLNLSKWARTGFIGGEAACMFGIVPVSVVGNVARPWMVGTSLLDRYAKTFLRKCAAEVEEMQSRYRRLENYIDARNVRAIAWLEWLGFKMGEIEPVGPFKTPFILFSREVSK